MKIHTMRWLPAALLAAALAPAALLAQTKPAGLQAIEGTTSGVAMLSFRTRGGTEVDMRGSERMFAAFGSVHVEGKSGSVEIKVGRGDLKGFSDPQSFGRDFLTYVLWVVRPDGTAIKAGEISLREGASESLTAATAEQVFWLMVTAEPDFAVSQPSPIVVMVSQNQDQSRTGNKAQAVAAPLVYFTQYTDYDTSAAPEKSAGWDELLQARKAVELAGRTGALASAPAAGATAAPDESHARDLLALARDFLSQAESAAQGATDSAQPARTATQLAEAARALASGASGRLRVFQFEQLRTQLERELANLRDRSSQIEASLDQERHHTRELESEVLSLRERVTSLEATAERARANAARLEEQRGYTCTELHLQLASMGHLTEQGGAVMLDLASDVLFDSGRYELRAAAREGLGRLAALRRLFFPRAVLRFEGHTDLVGEEDYNQWLSEQRALSVFRYFLEDAIARTADDSAKAELDTELSVAEQLLKMNYNTARRQASQRQELLTLLGNRVVGKGMREPLMPEKGPNEQNRRVTLILVAGESGGSVSFCPMGESNP